MKKYLQLQYLFAVLILIFFVLIMNSGDYLKASRTERDDFPVYHNSLVNDVQNLEWQKAEDDFNRMIKAWEIIAARIQFSVEKDEITAINVNHSRLQSYISEREKTEALVELAEMWEHWTHLNN